MVDLRIALVEDNRRYLASLQQLFEHTDGFEIAGAFFSAHDAIASIDETWDVVLMDIIMPNIDGIQATSIIKRHHHAVSVIMLTVCEEPNTILRAICAGADGYLLKKCSARELLTAARDIAEGGAPMTAGVAKTILDLLRRAGAPASVETPRLHLSMREQEVLRGLVNGRSYKQVADDLNISIDTVRGHIRRLYRKLQVHSVAEAVSRAIREDLV